MKAFVDTRVNMNQSLKLAFQSTENILGQGENAGYQHVFLYPNIFKSLQLKGISTVKQENSLERIFCCILVKRTPGYHCCWLVVLKFNVTLTAKVISWW